MEQLTTREIQQVNDINIHTQEMEFGTKFNEQLPMSGTPVNGVASSGVLTVSGVALDSETITIGDDVYEFAADADQSVSAGNFAIDIEAATTKSTINLTVDAQPTSGDTMTIGAKTYIFVPDTTDNADGEITIGTDLATAQAAIVAAINGTDGHNVAHADVSAGDFAANVSAITALVGGVAGDSIASTETFTAGTNVFAGATLAGGADCSAADAITAIVASVTANDTQGVGAADGAGDTVDFTADDPGVAGDSIATTEAMTNGAFGAATLENGVDGTAGTFGQMYIDSSYVYFCTAPTVWKRSAITAF